MNEFIKVLITNIANMFKVKTIITLCIVFAFCFLTVSQREINQEFMLIISSVITYFFAKESGKTDRKDG